MTVFFCVTDLLVDVNGGNLVRSVHERGTDWPARTKASS